MRSVLRAGVIAMVTAVSGCSSAPTHFYTLLPPPSNTSVPEASFAVHVEPSCRARGKRSSGVAGARESE